MSTLLQKSQEILDEKDSKVIAGNIKAGVTIYGVTGNVVASKEEANKNVTPTTSQQVITPTSGNNYTGMAQVTVAAVDNTIDANITQGNIKSGVTILGVTGNVVELNGETKTVNPSTSSQTIVPTGTGKNALTQVTVNPVTSAIDANIVQSNIKAGVTILGVTGNVEPDKPDQTKTATPTTSQQVIEPDNGYELASVTVNAVTSAIDNNIVAENIKKNVSILGVTGTFEGGDAKVYATVAAMNADLANVENGKYGIIADSNFQELYQKINGAWLLVGQPEENLASFEELNDVLGEENQYGGLGGTEEEIVDILEEVVNGSSDTNPQEEGSQEEVEEEE